MDNFADKSTTHAKIAMTSPWIQEGSAGAPFICTQSHNTVLLRIDIQPLRRNLQVKVIIKAGDLKFGHIRYLNNYTISKYPHALEAIRKTCGNDICRSGLHTADST
jgi:hypothetical protein